MSASVRRATRPRVLLTTEGTYPFVIGGVSTWCDLVIEGLPEFEWQVFAITAGGMRRDPVFRLPPHAQLVATVDLWMKPPVSWQSLRRPERTDVSWLPAALLRSLLSWEQATDVLVETLVWCRLHPRNLRRAFHDRAGWESFVDALEGLRDETSDESGPVPVFDTYHAAQLYQTLYWVARTAAVPTPPTEVLHVTAAGWAGIPALVHRALHGTPLLLTEHGVYVREAYLSAARSRRSPPARFASTRLARGMTRALYAAADVISPVTEANAHWEESLGARPECIRPIYNGVPSPADAEPPPGTLTVVSVGRVDPLKDVKTLLRVCKQVVQVIPEARFLHYGPVDHTQEAYAKSCRSLHAELGLGESFRFMGSTSDPLGVVRQADVLVLTSISEGLPLALLEAMSQSRPVVATAVGGVAECVRGCGYVAPPGDVKGLAGAIVSLLRDPTLARVLGERGRARVERRFGIGACLDGYRDLLSYLAAPAVAS